MKITFLFLSVLSFLFFFPKERTTLKANTTETFVQDQHQVTYHFKVLNENSFLIYPEDRNSGFLILKDKDMDVSKLQDISTQDIQVQYFKNYLILIGETESYVLNIPSFKDKQKRKRIQALQNATTFNVLGITKMYGNNTVRKVMKMNPYKKSKDDGDHEEISCTSGGPGAKHCGISSTIATVGNGCEVSCEEGYYACCDDKTFICKCVKAEKVGYIDSKAKNGISFSY